MISPTRINPMQSRAVPMQSSVLPGQTETDLDVTSIFSVMLPVMMMVMMMKVISGAIGSRAKTEEAS